MKPLLFLSLIFSSIFLFNCNQTEDFDQFETLAEKEWELISVSLNGIESIQDCERDDKIIFTDASAFNYQVGDLVCDNPTEIEKISDSWKLTEEFTVIRIRYKLRGNNARGDLLEYWRINELSDSRLVLEDAIATSNGQVPEIRTYSY